MGTVVEFKRAEPDMTEASGEAICLECKHEWVACVEMPSAGPVPWLECPSCSTHKGRFKFKFSRGNGELWHCNCGNNLFQLTPDYTYCPACGEKQVF